MNKAVWCLLAFALFFSLPIFAATPSVAVIYPELRAPYNKIFEDIADGVEQKVNGRTKRYALPKNYSSEQLDIWLKKNNTICGRYSHCIKWRTAA
jgi:putative ABC transport system substrate-binding protein